MNSSQHHLVTGLVALALDESGNGVLESLASRAKHFDSPLIHCKATPVTFAEDLVSAMSGLLNPQHPAAARVDRVHVLIITDQQQHADVDILRAVCSTVLAARKKFQSRMGRAILSVRDRFQPLGGPGQLRALPRRTGARRAAGVDAFDLVVLLDTQRADGSPHMTLESAAESHAAILANLMLSDFEESIYKLLEHQRGPLGSDGLFASFGVAELGFSGQEALQSIEEDLWRRMARKIFHDATAAAPVEVSRGESWQEEVEARLLAEPCESADAFWIEKFHRQGVEKLQRCFEASAYNPGALLRFLAQREEYLIRLRDRTRARSAAFMDEFVPRHDPAASPLRKAGPRLVSTREYGWTRIATLLLCMAGFATFLIGSVIAGSSAVRFPILLVLALLAGSALTLLFTRRADAKDVEASPPARQRDVIAELRRHRASGEIASGLLKRHRKLRKSMESDIDALQAELSEPHALQSRAALALPETLIDELLKANGVDVQQALADFWEQAEERLAARPAAREKSLPHRLGRYVANRCAVLSGLRINDVLGYLGGPAALDNSSISREIDRLQSGSCPWMPVGGLAAGVVLALPETLSEELRHSIAERFQNPVFVVPTKRESIVALQWTQGYLHATADASPKAIAL
jgi:hypothetical protein